MIDKERDGLAHIRWEITFVSTRTDGFSYTSEKFPFMSTRTPREKGHEGLSPHPMGRKSFCIHPIS
jgi:hypothetical protein